VLIAKHAFTGDARGKEQACEKIAAPGASISCVGHTAHERLWRYLLQPTESFVPATPSPSYVMAESPQALGFGDDRRLSALCFP